ncbi:MAG: hypothetical protein R2851_20885 [Caldilineaceae bacterium]
MRWRVTAFPARRGRALAAAALLAGIPEFAFIGGAANNDNAAALFGTLALWGGVAILRGEGRVRRLVDAACSGPGPAVQDEHVGCVACGGRGDCGRRGGGA